MQCTVCQEMGHLGLLILPLSKDYSFPLKSKETEDTVEDGTVSNGGTKDPFLLCFLSSSQPLVGLWTRNLSILRGYFMAWMLGPVLCAPGPAMPLIQDPTKPLVGPRVGNAQNRDHDTLRWWDAGLVCRSGGTHCSPRNTLHVLLDRDDLQDASVSPA